MAATLSIPEFYAGQDVFITGASGFMGKVLVEKLLRSCPNVKTIFLLMRAKKGMTPEQRIEKITQLPLFEPLKKLDPAATSKLVPIYGDVMENHLGILEEDLQRLMDVSVVFHAAASVRFDEPLREAVLMNTKGTQQVLELALKMKKIKVVLHVSTAYCNCDRFEVDEKLYPAHADWRKTLEIVEKVDAHTLSVLSHKFIGKLPNTYTFAKSLAEHVMKDYRHLLPVVIFRPTVVVATYKEPLVGWVDNFNGPMGLIIGGGKGFLRTTFADPETFQDYIPVDVAINAAIVASWQRGIQGSPPEELPVYNCSSTNSPLGETVGTKQMVDLGQKFLPIYPYSNVLWRPKLTLTHSKIRHYLMGLLFHLLPALLIDSILIAFGNKPILTRLQKRVFIANNALAHFLTHTWSFPNKKFMALEETLLPRDKETFTFDMSKLDVEEYFLAGLKGSRLYLLKDGPETYPADRKHYQRMVWVDRITKGIFLFFLCYVFYKKRILQLVIDWIFTVLNS